MPLSPIVCSSCGAANRAQSRFCNNCGNPLTSGGVSPSGPTGRLASGQLLEQRYRIIQIVGQGGFGAVYKAVDMRFVNRLVAVKEMRQNGLDPQEVAEAAQQFKSEANLLAGLKHPSLPGISDHFSANGRWYLVMDFIEGETLAEHLNKAKGGVLPIPEVISIGIQLSKVLGYLHTRSTPVIFRDLKPSNVMLTPDGNVYLIDFGIARFFKPGQVKDTAAYGSAGYSSPEQYGKAQTTPQSDIYSLGATLHEMLSGNDPSSNPFHFAPLQSLGQSTLAELAALITRMLDMHPQKRPSSIVEVQQALERMEDQRQHPTVPPTVAVPPTAAVPPTVAVPKKKGVSCLMVFICLIGLIAVGGIALAAAHFSHSSSQYQPSFTTQTFIPSPTQTSVSTSAQTSIPDIRGTYYGSYQLLSSSSSHPMTLDITRQNQQDFGGTCTLGSGDYSIQNGTVDTSGTIRFSIDVTDSAGNQFTVKFTGTAQSDGGWSGSFYDIDEQGKWYVY